MSAQKVKTCCSGLIVEHEGREASARGDRDLRRLFRRGFPEPKREGKASAGEAKEVCCGLMYSVKRNACCFFASFLSNKKEE